VPAIPVLDLQALLEVADDALAQQVFAGGIQVCLLAQRTHQNLQPLQKRVVAEILEPRRCARRGEQFLVSLH
jgi:hypothetical protein